MTRRLFDTARYEWKVHNNYFLPLLLWRYWDDCSHKKKKINNNNNNNDNDNDNDNDNNQKVEFDRPGERSPE